MDAQADLHVCCSHMAKTGFLMMWLILSDFSAEVKQTLTVGICYQRIFLLSIIQGQNFTNYTKF